MGFLLDTHVALWWLEGALPDSVRRVLEAEPETYVSPVTLWEVTVKQSCGKLGGPTDLAERVRDAHFRPLPITLEHAIVAGRLPGIHRDPFDRMLVAQAKCAELTLVTRDAHVQKYDVDVLVA